MAYVPFAPEFGAKYTITGPDGSVAVFNDPTDANYVGMLTEVTGLDSALIRESADDLVGTDGGWHGSFWYGRRPITMSGIVFGHSDANARAVRLDRMRRAYQALRADALMQWTNTALGAVTMRTWVRAQQPLRISAGWNKEFQMLWVSRFAPLFSDTLHTNTGTPQTNENQGNYGSYPTIRITGPSTNPVVTNTTTGAVLKFLTGYTVASGHFVDVDTLNHTAMLDGTTSNTGSLDFVNSTWPTLAMGNNTFTLSGGGTLTITWRDCWS